jgi:DNA-binding CsgD family transcriptional regulator
MAPNDAPRRTPVQRLQALAVPRPGQLWPVRGGDGRREPVDVSRASASVPRPSAGDGLPALLDRVRVALEDGDRDEALALLAEASALAAARPAVPPREPDAREGTPPSRAERRVLVLLAEDLTLAEIAERLVLSRNTVKSHVRLLYRRLGAGTRAEAVARARQRGLL